MTTIQENLLIESERCLIGSVLIDNSVIDEINLIIEPRDFIEPVHEMIWTAIDYMNQNDKIINVVTLTEMLIRFDRLGEITGGFDYISRIISHVTSIADARYHAQLVKKFSLRRRAINIADSIKNLVDKNYEDEEEFYREVESLTDSIRTRTSDTISSFETTRSEYEMYLEEKTDYISTGFSKFDKWTKGLGRGWLYVLAARPSVGKTAKMLAMARNIALNKKGAVIVFSNEMKTNELINRIISSMTAIPLSRIRSHRFKDGERLQESELNKIKNALDELQGTRMYFQDRGHYSIDEVRTICRSIKRECGEIDSIFVDYLGLMNIPHHAGQTYSQAVGKVSNKAKSIAVELNSPFILLSQLNREVEKRADKKPLLSDLRESGNIEQDADVVEFLWTDEKEEKKGEESHPHDRVINSTIAKGRDIGVHNFKYIFSGWNQSFKEMRQ
jgi:replicative DNA helicase